MTWLKQTKDKPLFENLMWSKPENKTLAGKLTIIGGNSQGFSIPVQAYMACLGAGAGVVHVLLPDSTQKLIGKNAADVYFASSTKSGGFSRAALIEFLEMGQWADGVYIAGDIGNNSETVILIESFLEKYKDLLILSNDAVKMATNISSKVVDRPNTIIVTGIGYMQKLTANIKLKTIIKHSLDLVNLVEAMQELTKLVPSSFIIEHQGYLIVASSGKVSTTQINDISDSWQTEIGSNASVWAIQNSSKIFEALTCAVINK
jgi:NAD(P)H-hydrate repair Nnr-like enzyme with NAD(P)H-hydrate dehydratase domain